MTTASFRDFERSVSDAWNAGSDDLLPPTHRNIVPTATVAAAATPPTANPTVTAVSASSAGRTTTPHSSPIKTKNSLNSVSATASDRSVNNGSGDTARPSGTPHSANSSPAKRIFETGIEERNASRVDRVEKFLTSSDSIDCDQLRQLAWSGLAPRVRSKAWKILCGYLPGSVVRQKELLQRKQDEYAQYVKQYFHTKDQDVHQDTYRQIHIDIPRMSPVIGLFQQRCVQEIFERILFIWAIRHPASGYVQGINDLVTPFFLVFLQDYCEDGQDVSEIDVGKALTAEQVRESREVFLRLLIPSTYLITDIGD